MGAIIMNMNGMIGNMRFMKLVTMAVKSFFQKNQAFIIVVIEDDGNASVHSNMDKKHERISLLEQTVNSLKSA